VRSDWIMVHITVDRNGTKAGGKTGTVIPRKRQLKRQEQLLKFSLQNCYQFGALALVVFFISYIFGILIFTSSSFFTSTTHDAITAVIDNTHPMIRRSDQQVFFDRLIRNREGENNGNSKEADQERIDHPMLQLDNPNLGENSDFLDVVANDVITTLSCHSLLTDHAMLYRNQAFIYGNMPRKNSMNENVTDDGVLVTPDMEDDEMAAQALDVAMITGAHLFCLAAFPQQSMKTNTDFIPSDEEDVTEFWKDKVQCGNGYHDNAGNGKGLSKKLQASLLDLWSTARAEIIDESIILQTLRLVVEKPVVLMDRNLNVWAVPRDDATNYLLRMLNEQKKAQEQLTKEDVENKVDGSTIFGGIAGLGNNLGYGKLFVDIGSGLGYTSMAVALLYPGTEIVSIEAAPTNWLLQEMNWRCNDFSAVNDDDGGHGEIEGLRTKVILSGVGPSIGTSQMAKFAWRPSAGTRAWNLHLDDFEKSKSSVEAQQKAAENDIELTVKLQPWHLLKSQADIKGHDIDVLNIDCEGCEYNLIPALEVAEFESIRAILGEVHWGYIPPLKLPSSQRGRTTHERLCHHENFVRSAKECCAFPDLTVKSAFSGQVLVIEGEIPPRGVTVKDLITNDLCDSFEQWALDHNLNNVESDWAWFQVK
jgi:FkbM family methyltransferase